MATAVGLMLWFFAMLICLVPVFPSVHRVPAFSFPRWWLANGGNARYGLDVRQRHSTPSLSELRERLRPFCEKHRIRRLEIFGSAARGQTTPGSDVDLLATFDESAPISTAELLEVAGEAEELIGHPVDFVLRSAVEKSPNQFAREHILSTAVSVYGS